MGYGSDVHLEREIKSLGKQLSYIIYCMKHATSMESTPILHLASYTGEVKDILEPINVHNWKVLVHEKSVFDVFPAQNLVYLSPDSPNVLETVENDIIYVIGGIVDRTVSKGTSLNRAKEYGIRTAKLPLKEHIDISKVVLNVNTV